MNFEQALIEADFPPRATQIFENVKVVGYTNVTGELSQQFQGTWLSEIRRTQMTGEIFGPILPVLTVGSIDDYDAPMRRLAETSGAAVLSVGDRTTSCRERV